MSGNHNDPSADEADIEDDIDIADDTSDDLAPPLRFHEKVKGRGVVLSNNGRTAGRKGGYCIEGQVLSCDPMEIDYLYQVRVDKIDTLYDSAYIYLGVVTESPDTVVLPRWPGHPRSGVVVYYEWFMVNGEKSPSSVGSSLRDMKEGSLVGLTVDQDRTLHLYKNGTHQGAITGDIPLPCYFMVDVGYCCRKVTALPVQRL
ncbi:hypothetical protein ACOMHN_006337 [Nucella lapillus]